MLKMNNLKIGGKIVDVVNKKITRGDLFVENGRVVSIIPNDNVPDQYVMPGFIDAHVHIESSMLLPTQFARVAVRHGTIAAVSDPHEIANVCGIQGVLFMIENGNKTPFHFYFGAPSCVPATPFDNAGSVIDDKDVAGLLERDDIYFLSEMMNFPGAVRGDSQILNKIKEAIKLGKKIDGHAPGLSGADLKKYIKRGISTDHECIIYSEAVEKIKAGMKILIREGSAARNMKELLPLLREFPDKIMFCTDDSHPDTLIKRHINFIVKEALSQGYDLFDVLRAASFNTIEHYGLNVGLLRVEDKADFIVVDSLDKMNVITTYINGEIVFENSLVQMPDVKPAEIPNNFNARNVSVDDLKVEGKGNLIRVIELIDGELYTKALICEAKIENGLLVSDLSKDIIKLVVLNRYKPQKPQIAFVKGFGLSYGAMAGSIAHDSHNILAVGVHDDDIVSAVNNVIESKGGLAIHYKNTSMKLPLPVAGIMSLENAEAVAEKFGNLEITAKKMGSTLQSPFMALSFLSLLVIPELKLGDKGLFDVNKFEFVELFVE